MSAHDFFGILDAVKRLTPPAGLEAAHLDGFSWARNGATYGASTKLTADDWNRILGNLRAVLIGSGLDLEALDPASPNLLRDVMAAYISAKIVEEFPGLFVDNKEDFAAALAAIPAFVSAIIAGLPLAVVAKSGDTMTGPLVLSGDPVAALQAATKQYVDNVAGGLDPKPSVRAATTANIALTGTQTIDGISLAVGERALVKDQSTPAQNGIYVVAAGAWSRAADMDAWSEVPGANVWVEEGTVNGDRAWTATANAGGTLGTTAITWTLFAGTGVFQQASAVLTALAAIGTAVAGDVIFASGAGVWARLAKGANGQFMSLSGGVPAWTTLPFSKSFESAAQAITSAGPLTLAHGLATTPKLYLAVLKCATAEGGYSVGDEVAVAPVGNVNATSSKGASLVPDATNINVRFGSDASAFNLVNKTSGATFGITNANWQLVVRAWA